MACMSTLPPAALAARTSSRLVRLSAVTCEEKEFLTTPASSATPKAPTLASTSAARPQYARALRKTQPAKRRAA